MDKWLDENDNGTSSHQCLVEILRRDRSWPLALRRLKMLLPSIKLDVLGHDEGRRVLHHEGNVIRVGSRHSPNMGDPRLRVVWSFTSSLAFMGFLSSLASFSNEPFL